MARTASAIGQLRRILGDEPAGWRAGECWRGPSHLRPGVGRCTGLASLGLPGEPLADAWRLADMLREYRGDAHVSAWTAAGFDATEIGLLTEPYWGLPLRARADPGVDRRAQLDAAEARLVERELLQDGGLTPRGGPSARRSRWRPTGSAARSSRRSATTSTACSASSCRGVRRSGPPAGTGGVHDLADAVRSPGTSVRRSGCGTGARSGCSVASSPLRVPVGDAHRTAAPGVEGQVHDLEADEQLALLDVEAPVGAMGHLVVQGHGGAEALHPLAQPRQPAGLDAGLHRGPSPRLPPGISSSHGPESGRATPPHTSIGAISGM